MQYCKNCGYGMDDKATKCPRCGKKTGKSSTFSKFLMVIIGNSLGSVVTHMLIGGRNNE